MSNPHTIFDGNSETNSVSDILNKCVFDTSVLDDICDDVIDDFLNEAYQRARFQDEDYYENDAPPDHQDEMGWIRVLSNQQRKNGRARHSKKQKSPSTKK